MKITFITSNRIKIAQFLQTFQDGRIEVDFVGNEKPEIQADSGVEVAADTALYYAKKLNTLVVREDHCLYINALPGFPGPYTHYFDDHMSAEALLAALRGAEDRSGYFLLAAVVAAPDGRSWVYTDQVPIYIAETAAGSRRNFDRVLIREGETLTFAQQADQGIETPYGVWDQNIIAIRRDLENGVFEA